MEYEIVELEEMIVEGIGIRTTNQEGKGVQDIGTAWQQFFTTGVYAKIGNKVNQKTIGLYTDYESDCMGEYLFMASAQVKEASKNLEDQIIRKIPKGKYAKFVITGDVKEAVGKAWIDIWNLSLNRAYTTDFEEYQNNTQDMAKQEIHIYIALK